MMGISHLTIGAASGLGIGLARNASMLDCVLLAVAGGAAALLPDIDHPNGTIRNRAGLPGHVAFFWLSHRGITHTLLAMVAVAVLASEFLPPLAGAIVAGYGSHLFGDGITRQGIPFFWPLSRRQVHILPGGLRLRTGSLLESAVWISTMIFMVIQVYERFYDTP